MTAPRFRWVPLILLALLPPVASAASEPATGPGQVLYRYTTPDGDTSISATLNQQAIHAGYQVLDRNGRVIRREPPAPPEEQVRRRQALQKQRQAQQRLEQDKELQRLYAGPEDAVRARERQLEALELRINYANKTLRQLEHKRDQEVSTAARAERAGRPVPEGTREAINAFERRLEQVREDITEYQQDQQKVRQQYQPIIQRLKQLEDG